MGVELLKKLPPRRINMELVRMKSAVVSRIGSLRFWYFPVKKDFVSGQNTSHPMIFGDLQA